MKTSVLFRNAMLIAVACVAGPAWAGEPELGEWGVDLSAMDRTVDPGDDFFRHVSGTWLKNAEYPKGLLVTGAFVDVLLGTETQLKRIVADLPPEERGRLW